MFIPMSIVWLVVGLFIALLVTLYCVVFRPDILLLLRRRKEILSVAEVQESYPGVEDLLHCLGSAKSVAIRTLGRRDLRRHSHSYSSVRDLPANLRSLYPVTGYRNGELVEGTEEQVYAIFNDGTHIELSFDALGIEPHTKGDRDNDYWDGNSINEKRTGPDVGSVLRSGRCFEGKSLELIVVRWKALRREGGYQQQHGLVLLKLPPAHILARMTYFYSEPQLARSA